MNQKEAKQLVWKWVAIQMDLGMMQFNVGAMLLAVDDDELPPREVERLTKAWEQVRDRAGRLAGEES